MDFNNSLTHSLLRPVNMTLCSQVRGLSHGYDIFSRVLNGYLTALCVICGVVGNVMSIKSIRFTHFDRNRGVALAAAIMVLAFWDTVLLFCALLYYGFKNLFPSSAMDNITRVTPMFHAFSQISNTASIWSVAAITVQRYLATRDPFKRTTRWLLFVSSSEISEQQRVMLYSFRVEKQQQKGAQSLCRFIRRYRKHFRGPLLLSLVALIVNLPAFLEIDTIVCYLAMERRLAYGLQVSKLRLNSVYKLWYKVFFRMLLTSCGPNIFILCLTVLTVVLLRRSSRTRKKLFNSKNESTISSLEFYSARSTMLTMISVVLATKFLLLRSPSFLLDIWEITFGLRHRIRHYIYLVDISNFLIILNSATNSLIIYRASKWLQDKLTRNTVRNKLHLGLQKLNSKRKLQLIRASWTQLRAQPICTSFGRQVLHAILTANPQMAHVLREEESGELPVSIAAYPAYPGTSTDGMHAASETENDPSCDQCAVGKMEAIEEEALLEGNQLTLLPRLPLMGIAAKTGAKVAIVAPFPRGEASTIGVQEHEKRGIGQQQGPTDFPGSEWLDKLGQLITLFIEEVITMMEKDESDQAISARIQLVGRVHFDLGITFPSSAWKEFKSKSLEIVTECNFADEKERGETLEAWSAMLSKVIREMKMGMWRGDERKSSKGALRTTKSLVS